MTHTRHLILFLCFLLAGNAYSVQKGELLSGTPIGSRSYDYSTGRPSTTVNTPSSAFDGDFSTFYASYDRSRTWVGLDLGTPHVITQVGWCPRKGQPKRVQLGLFEASNSPDFLDAVPLYLIPNAGEEMKMEYAKVQVTRGFRYVRYVGPNDARCNIGELAFYGYEGEGVDSVWYQVTNLPTVSIHTYTGNDPQDKVNEIESNITITYDRGTRIQEYPITARGRGNASWGFPKKPYRIKFADGKSHHMLKDSPEESPAKAKKWTLINNYGDKTLMRNCLAFEVSRRLEADYTPWCQLVDVIMNGEYKGTYQLCDQISVDKNRVPITEMETWDNEEPELTGGYLIEVDAYANQETSWFNSNRGIPVTIKSPQDDEITTQQKTYIRNYFNQMESAAWSTNYTDPEQGYRQFLITESFLKHFITGEFAGNTDVYWSTYMYKDREESRFHVAPSWDFDLAFDNDSRIYPVSNRSDWVYKTGGSSAGNMSSFVTRILSDPALEKELKHMWKANRKEGLLDEKSLIAYIDSLAELLDASQRLNFIRWPILNESVHLNVTARGSFEAEVQVLRNYVPTRLAWFDNHLGIENDIEYNDTTFMISTPDQLIEFAEAVNHGAVYSNAYLMADIDMTGRSGEFRPIGLGSKVFRGRFNGQGHRISHLHVSSDNFTGLFGVIGGGAEISNFILDSTCSVKGNAYVGVIGGSNGAGTVSLSRIGNEADITAAAQNAGGIIGCNYGSSCTFVITNCYNAGAVTGDSESGSISGWVGTGAVIQNCYNIGSVTGYNYRNEFYRGGATVTNCFSTMGSQVTRINTSQAESGELCFKLNYGETKEPVWYQTIGEDKYPMLDSTHCIVYEKEDKTYYNLRIIRGDVDDNGLVDGTDADWMALYLNGQAPDGFCLDNADANNDGLVNVCDLVEIRRMALAADKGNSQLTGRIYSGTASVKACGTRKVTVWISSDRKVTAYEADIVLSDGLSIDPSSVAFGTKINSSDHKTILTPTAHGLHFVVYSDSNANLQATSGIAFTFTLQGDESFEGGTMQLKGQYLAASDGSMCNSPNVKYDILLAKTAVAAIALDPSSIDIIAGQQVQVAANILPVYATIRELNWTSSDNHVASVDKTGLIKAIASGTTSVKATATDGSGVSSTVMVNVYTDEDAISNVLTDPETHTIYNLAGQRLHRITSSGIYIIDGKKHHVIL